MPKGRKNARKTKGKAVRWSQTNQPKQVKNETPPQRASYPRAAKRPISYSPSEASANLKGKKAKLDTESEDVKFHIHERHPKHSFDDLAGMKDIKEQLMKRIIMPFAYQSQASFLNIAIPRGILLVGVPGTGKTAMVDCIVNELRKIGKNVRYFRETGSCMSRYYGETEANIRDLFKAAHEEPCVLFLDEIDGLGKARSDNDLSSVNQTVVTTLLSEIDDLDCSKVLLVAATNNETHVDSALIRTGRFDETLHVPLPDNESRKSILELYFKKMELQISSKQLGVVVKSSEGLTGSDLECIVKNVHSKVIDRVFPSMSWCTMSKAELSKKKQLSCKTRDDDIYPTVQQFIANRNRKQG